MSDSSINKVLVEIKKSKEELRNIILASETRLQLKIEELTFRLSQIEEENSTLKKQVEYLERQNKEKNIVIFGLEKESKELNVDFICREFKNLLDVQVEHFEISNLQPLGRNKNCPLKVEFLSNIKKQHILRNSNKLKGTGIFIAHDLTKKQREERKFLKKHLDQQRNLGKPSKIKGNKLIVENQEYNIEQLQKIEYEEEERKINSTPATPTQYLIKDTEPEPKADSKYISNNTPVAFKNTLRKNLRSNSSSNSNKTEKVGKCS